MNKTIALVMLAILASGCALKGHKFQLKTAALSFSLGCEAADLATSMYVFGQKTGVELNPLLAGVQDQPLRFAARKALLAAPLNVGGAWLIDHDRKKAGAILLVGNGIAKCLIASRNDRYRRP